MCLLLAYLSRYEDAQQRNRGYEHLGIIYHLRRTLSHLLTLLGEAKELDHLGAGTKPTTGCRLGWGRRDQMDLREVGAHPPGITGQESLFRNQGMGSNEKVGER